MSDLRVSGQHLNGLYARILCVRGEGPCRFVNAEIRAA
jgi:hypothetical protein